MKYIWILLLGMVLLAGCTTTQPIPTQKEIEYADPSQPLVIINESEAQQIVEDLGLDDNESILNRNLTENLTLEDLGISDADYQNVDLTPTGVYDSATGERLDLVENETDVNVTTNETINETQ